MLAKKRCINFWDEVGSNFMSLLFFISPRTKRLRSFETSTGGAGRSLGPVVPDLRLLGVIGRKDYEGVNHNTGARTGFFG